MSSAGYHPPERGWINPSKVPVVAVARGYLRLVIDPLRPRSAWFREADLTGLHPYSRYLFTQSRP